MNFDIPIMKLKLPEASDILPYLNMIDQNGIYSNFGPLVKKFEKSISNQLGIDENSVTTISNATLAIYCALQAFDLPKNSYCIMPSWTFTATPAAAMLAGLTPYFVDVDINSQALTPEMIYREFEVIPESIKSVVVVCPFGAPINIEEWVNFQEDTGIKVIIDGAAAYDSFVTGLMPVTHLPFIVSLHATKILGIGEGSFVAATDKNLIKKIKNISGFGFVRERESEIVGINSKMPEYTAAVALAALDTYIPKKLQYQKVRDLYIKYLDEYKIQHDLSSDYIGTTCNIMQSYMSNDLEKYLHENSIETRKWWGNGCHTQSAYRHCPAGDLANTKKLASLMLGIPFFYSLQEENVEFIVSKINEFNNQPSLVANF